MGFYEVCFLGVFVSACVGEWVGRYCLWILVSASVWEGKMWCRLWILTVEFTSNQDSINPRRYTHTGVEEEEVVSCVCAQVKVTHTKKIPKREW